jgi:hypothetical protein
MGGDVETLAKTPPAHCGLCREQGETAMPETVVHFQIRMPPSLHEQLASWAKEDKVSLNALIVGILERAIEHHEKAASKPGADASHA